MARIAVIGSGFSGLSAAAYLSKEGHEVHVFEKNAAPGGRARQFRTEEGFVFDMGPSWYWMPGVFEKFFQDFGHRSSDFYNLKLLNPSFEITFGSESIKIPYDFQSLCELFECIEKGGGHQLKKFMAEAELKYRIGMENMVYKPSLSIREFMQPGIIRNSIRSDVFLSFSKHVRKYFRDVRLIALMEFPVLFLGARPGNIPALYSLMNYAGLKLGTWYPEGGFGKVIEAMMHVGQSNGALFHFNQNVERIVTKDSSVIGVIANGKTLPFDGVVASADYHHVEKMLLNDVERNYNEKYWETRTLAPSSLIFYLGVNKKIDRLEHHTLFFDESLDRHSDEIYTHPQWPTRPLFYCCCPSKSDDRVAPQGHENIFLLMPIAPDLEDNDFMREKYYSIMMKRLEEFAGESISERVVYKRSYCINEFIADYNSYKGNAYGLANTLSQTAVLKPRMNNRKLKNLFYAGQLTVPGPGVPPSIISGKLAAGLMNDYLLKVRDEVAV